MAFLGKIKESKSPYRYSNILKALRHYSRFIGKPYLFSEFAFPHPSPKPKRVWSKEELRRFYEAIPTLKMKTFFLVVASNGLRKGELLSLKIDDVDFSRRMLIPKCHKGSSKKSWISFYNEEAEEALRKYMEGRNIVRRGLNLKDFSHLTPITSRRNGLLLSKKHGIKLKVKDLRD